MCRGWRENIPPMKCVADRLKEIFIVADYARFMGYVGVNKGEHSVIGPNEILPLRFDEYWPARRPHARVDHHHMNRLRREIAIRLGDQIGALGNFKRSHLVTD